MSVKASTWAWAQQLPVTEKFLLIALADNADDFGICWPGQAHLSKKTGLHRTTISTAAKSLVEKGLIQIEARKVRGVQRSNRYTLNLGLMIIPCSAPLHDHVAPCDTAMSLSATLETSIESSVEPSIAQSAFVDLGTGAKSGDSDMKSIGEGTVEEILKAAKGDTGGNPTHHIPGLAKKGTQYLTGSLEKIYKQAYSYYGFGFVAEFTVKQRGQFTGFQKKLQGIDAAQVICCTIKNWSRFMEMTDAYKPPKTPVIGFMLVHATHAGELYVQSLAQKKHKVQPLFKPVTKPKNLTNETGKTDNDADDIAELEDMLK